MRTQKSGKREKDGYVCLTSRNRKKTREIQNNDRRVLMCPRTAHKKGSFSSIDHKFTLTFILSLPWRKLPLHPLPKRYCEKADR